MLRSYPILLAMVFTALLFLGGCIQAEPTDSPGEVFTPPTQPAQPPNQTVTPPPQQPATLAAPSCANQVQKEAAAQGDYRHYVYMANISIGDVAIAKNGWRAVAGGQDYNIYYFKRSESGPFFTFQTGGQVNAVAISDDGAAFAAGSYDGKIYYFECDSHSPSWIYDASQDQLSSAVGDVAITKDGKYVAAVAGTYVYLFRRDSGTPIMKQDLSQSVWKLATVALSDDGSKVFTGSFSAGNQSVVVLLDETGVVWTHAIKDLGHVSNVPIPVSISADGGALAAGGPDKKVHFWKGSSTPQWEYQIKGQLPVASVSLSKDGKKLAATGNFKLFFFDDTSKSQPTFKYDGDYGDPSAFFTQPEVYSGSKSEAGSYDIGNYENAISLSSDGSYLLAGDYTYGHAFSFYTKMDKPFRMYDLQNDYDSVGAVSLSSEGSWVMLGSGSGEIVRFEVAPVEIISVEIPVAYSIQGKVSEPIGGNKVSVDYTIIKPGRAAKLKEDWSMWAAPAMGALLIPPNKILCTGDMEWEYTQDLADGSKVVQDSRTITLPQCLSSAVSSIDFFMLHAELKDSPSSKKLSDDSTVLVKFQIGTGS